MNKNLVLRIVIDILIFVSVLNGWWFFALPLGLFGSYYFPYFAELVLAGVAYDSLFNFMPDTGLRYVIATIIAVVIVSVIGGLKKVIRK
jgi:hypothetical protein